MRGKETKIIGLRDDDGHFFGGVCRSSFAVVCLFVCRHGGDGALREALSGWWRLGGHRAHGVQDVFEPAESGRDRCGLKVDAQETFVGINLYLHKVNWPSMNKELLGSL